MTDPTATVHHPSWREIRAGFLSDPEVQQAYRELEPCFAVVNMLIEQRHKHGQTCGSG